MDPIVIPDLSICNTGSVLNMVKRAGGKALLLDKPDDRYRDHKLILPGVGSFDSGIGELEATGWKSFLAQRNHDDAGATLGICLGMQMLFDRSEEGSLPGLGLIPGSVVRFGAEEASLRIPHMGWNEVTVVRDNPLIHTAEPGGRAQRYYFVHSYHALCENPDDVLAQVSYGTPVTAAANRGKVYGVQFHPEKSHRFGMELIKRFIEM